MSLFRDISRLRETSEISKEQSVGPAILTEKRKKKAKERKQEHIARVTKQTTQPYHNHSTPIYRCSSYHSTLPSR
jgi:hypothetical protein